MSDGTERWLPSLLQLHGEVKCLTWRLKPTGTTDRFWSLKSLEILKRLAPRTKRANPPAEHVTRSLWCPSTLR